MEHRTSSEAESKKVAQAFAITLKGGELIELVGDLGAGKTTFVQGVAEALNVLVPVKSPTFTIMHEYPVKHETINAIIHLDLYRLKHVTELEALSLEDYRREDTVVFIEWPNKLSETYLEGDKKVEIEMVSDTERLIRIT